MILRWQDAPKVCQSLGIVLREESCQERMRSAIQTAKDRFAQVWNYCDVQEQKALHRRMIHCVLWRQTDPRPELRGYVKSLENAELCRLWTEMSLGCGFACEDPYEVGVQFLLGEDVASATEVPVTKEEIVYCLEVLQAKDDHPFIRAIYTLVTRGAHNSLWADVKNERCLLFTTSAPQEGEPPKFICV